MGTAEYMVQAFRDALGLPIQTAKQIVYYRMAADKVQERQFFPALAIIGPSGSGKSTIERGIRSMDPENCHWAACAGISTASMRDELAKGYNKLAVAEEFDEVGDLRAASRYVQARCDRMTSSLAYKEQVTDNGRYHAKTIELFGATVLHARNPLADPALVSRSITIYTHHEEGIFSEVLILPGWFKSAVAEVQWSEPITGFRGGRIFDTWQPVLQIAAGLADEEWLDWARTQVQLLQTRLQEAAGQDLRQLILSRIIEILVRREEWPGLNVWDRIGIEGEIGQHLRATVLPRVTPWEVSDAIRGLGMHTQRRGGKVWLEPSEASLLLACDAVGYHDDSWVEELRTRQTMQA